MLREDLSSLDTNGTASERHDSDVVKEIAQPTAVPETLFKYHATSARCFSSADWRLRTVQGRRQPLKVSGHVTRDGLVNKGHRKLRYMSADRRHKQPKSVGISLKKSRSWTVIQLSSGSDEDEEIGGDGDVSLDDSTEEEERDEDIDEDGEESEGEEEMSEGDGDVYESEDGVTDDDRSEEEIRSDGPSWSEEEQRGSDYCPLGSDDDLISDYEHDDSEDEQLFGNLTKLRSVEKGSENVSASSNYTQGTTSKTADGRIDQNQPNSGDIHTRYLDPNDLDVNDIDLCDQEAVFAILKSDPGVSSLSFCGNPRVVYQSSKLQLMKKCFTQQVYAATKEAYYNRLKVHRNGPQASHKDGARFGFFHPPPHQPTRSSTPFPIILVPRHYVVNGAADRHRHHKSAYGYDRNNKDDYPGDDEDNDETDSDDYDDDESHCEDDESDVNLNNCAAPYVTEDPVTYSDTMAIQCLTSVDNQCPTSVVTQCPTSVVTQC